MILDQITIRNYGVYHGSHQAVLTPIDGKPIVLFGGLNGGGKTTLLDAFQLALYGPKARLSNRGRLGYRDYLKQCINRSARAGEWAELQLDFSKVLNGTPRHFTVTRSWRDAPDGVAEELSVSLDGRIDPLFTEHWDEIVETYLPSSISHLFFFDGEQIAALAEQSSAPAIVGTAIHSLLGLDLVDRLQTDLKALERRKQSTALDTEAAAQLTALSDEREVNTGLQDSLALERGALENEIGRLRKTLVQLEATLQACGGIAFERQQELQAQLSANTTERQVYEEQLRQLAAGPLPLAIVTPALRLTLTQATVEDTSRKSLLFADELQRRDSQLLKALRMWEVPAEGIERISDYLSDDRLGRQRSAHCEIILKAEDGLPSELKALLDISIPASVEQAQGLVVKLADTEERIARLEAELSRVPEQDAVADLFTEIRATKATIDSKVAEVDAVTVRQEAARRRAVELDDAIQRVADRGLAAQQAEDSRVRIVKHSKKVRNTLDAFRVGVVKRHIASIEALVLDAFRSLLRKKRLIHALTINPDSFDVVLWQQPGTPLPIDRLSAGERQLLATALLWGLARAAGRPIPTIIDTPLGRLDSTHRGRLVDTYFPGASHQVLLLSTDEEIVGEYLAALKPHIGREYTLAHDDSVGSTSIIPGYFRDYEATV